ncbi:hypothetical protein H2198_007771 [Neophaeococcomyces mojaviensis]|uniref:Uncharacterized protein n=1 Tax=Neophaeococcomyces mojaviensis TaxID=3383035 RepID=A0ACC2ZZ37_9EURO|nr:hypothetical protein H2198_007771 [Knufia sp. JES_112]
MPEPVTITSGSLFRDTLRDYPIVFTMFHDSGIASRVMIPLFESACNDYASSSRAFVKIRMKDFPGIASEYKVKEAPTFIAFKKQERVGTVSSPDSRRLADLVEKHSKPSCSFSSKSKSSKCDYLMMKLEETRLKKQLLAIQDKQEKHKLEHPDPTRTKVSEYMNRSGPIEVLRQKCRPSRDGYRGRSYSSYVDYDDDDDSNLDSGSPDTDGYFEEY